MLPVPGELPTDPEQWAWEVKYDGFRAVVFCNEQGETRIQSRSLRPMTFAYPELADLGKAIGRPCVLDGEIVAVDEEGRPNFELMQERTGFFPEEKRRRRNRQIFPVVYQVFDLLYLDGRCLMRLPYRARRDELERLHIAGEHWHVPTIHLGPGARELQAASRQAGLEGLVAKRLESAYFPGERSPHWRKCKNWSRQEFVIAGYRYDEEGSQGWLGGLLLGCYTDQGLSYCGAVEAGYRPDTVSALGQIFPQLERPTNPFYNRQTKPHYRFLEPVLIGEVQFLDWTSLGHIRHASFKGFVFDRDPGGVRRET